MVLKKPWATTRTWLPAAAWASRRRAASLARTFAWALVSWPPWWPRNHHQKREMTPQARGFSLIQSGQPGGGRGASMKISSTARTRSPQIALAVSIERRRLEAKMSPALAAASAMCWGGDWPGSRPPIS